MRFPPRPEGWQLHFGCLSQRRHSRRCPQRPSTGLRCGGCLSVLLTPLPLLVGGWRAPVPQSEIGGYQCAGLFPPRPFAGKQSGAGYDPTGRTPLDRLPALPPGRRSCPDIPSGRSHPGAAGRRAGRECRSVGPPGLSAGERYRARPQPGRGFFHPPEFSER